jgi:hypothetical protein
MGNIEYRAHRVSYEIHFGQIPEGMFVCHTCDNPGCVNPQHLWLGDNEKNMADRKAKGRNSLFSGENHGMSKLSRSEVKAIRDARLNGAKYVELAVQYGIHESHARAICRRGVWGGVA